MNKQKKKICENIEVLKQIIKNLEGRKFLLDCGHHVTFGHNFGNHITILNTKKPEIICTQCGY